MHDQRTKAQQSGCVRWSAFEHPYFVGSEDSITLRKLDTIEKYITEDDNMSTHNEEYASR